MAGIDSQRRSPAAASSVRRSAKRSFLIALNLAMGLLALALGIYPFAASLSLNARQENAAWGPCDVSALLPGEVMMCGWTGVYRRTERDKASVSRYTHLLADPTSARSEQPEAARNPWRSVNADYFVYKLWAPRRRCGVKLVSPGVVGWRAPEAQALEVLPYFVEPCEGRTWDICGRLYRRDGYPPEENLIVPKVRWLSPGKVLIYIGWN